MEDCRLFIGEDFALDGQVIFEKDDAPASLDDFDLRIELSTTALGERLVCATSGAGEEIEVFRRGETGFAANIPNRVTTRLMPGDLVVGVMLIHKATGVRMIAEQRTIKVVESRIGQER